MLATVLAGALPAAVPLVQLSPTVYQTEHCLFVIDSSVHWANPAQAYSDLYAPSNGTFPKLAGYFDTLTSSFPNTYFSVCYLAATGASNVPNYVDRIYKASGINEPGTPGAPQDFTTVDLCRYNLGSYVTSPILAVYDHELGHAWGAQLFNGLTPPVLCNGHWLSNSTVNDQMSASYSDDGQVTVNQIYGDPVNGFRWQRVDNLRSNEIQVYSEQTLYLMGVQPTFPTSYVLNSPVYNANGTMGYASVDVFDHAQAVARYGVRNPDYTIAARQFRLGFIYVARDAAEVNTVYQVVERSIDQFCNGETVDLAAYRFQVPFLRDARYRASVVGRLADLDGNATPTLAVTGAYVTSTTGDATVGFSAADTSGTPTVAVVPISTHAVIANGTVQLSGLPDGVHFFTLKAEDTGGKKAFAHFVVEVHRPATTLTIAAHPAGATAVAGSPATFAVAATGTGANRAYRWMRQAADTSTWNDLVDGPGVSGTATAALTITASTTMNRDEVLCLVTDSSGGVTSQHALLVVNEVLPPLTTQPADRLLAAGNAVHLDLAVSGPPSTYGYYSYQWQRELAGTTTWSNLANGGGVTGATTASLTITGTTTAMSGDQYRCQVVNTAGAVTSNTATLTVHQRPSIVVQPGSVTTTAGQNATFTVTADGTGPLSYQWSRYGVAVPGATSATFTLTNVQSADAGAYTVSVTNAVGAAGSNVGSLVVNAAAPTISIQPQSLSTTVNAAVSLSVSAIGTTPISYQWKKNGTALAGATSPSLSFSNVQPADAADYSVVVTNSVGNATSAAATLSVTAVAVPPTITLAPVAVSGLTGQTVTFSVVAGGSAPLSYQWQKNGTPIASATAAMLTLTNVQPGDAGNYVVAVSNGAGSISSSAVALIVTDPMSPPFISTQPHAQAVTAGQSVTFTVAATGTAPLSYQWRQDGLALAGATTATLVLDAVTASHAGDYSVVVSNAAGSVGSLSARLDVVPPPQAPNITVQPQNTSVAAGATTSFSVTAAGATSYQWWHDGVAVAGATASTLVLGDVQLANCGSYSVVVTNSAGSATSAAATLVLSAVDFSGSYFGWFGTERDGGQFAFVLRPSGAGTFLARFAADGRVAVAAEVHVDANGRFTIGRVGAKALSASTDARIYSGEIDGQISGGMLTLLVPALGLSGNAPCAATGSVAIASVGLSEGVPIGRGAGEVYVETGDSGQALLVVLDPAGAQSVLGTVDAAGVFQATLGTGTSARTFRGTLGSGSFVGAVTSAVQSTTSYASAVRIPGAQRLVNISSRGFAGEADRTLIAGFVIAGSEPKEVLVRAVGPTLGAMGVSDALADPHLTLLHHGIVVLTNDDWGTASGDVAGKAALLGAAPLTPGSRDAALLVRLAPGIYTAHVRVPPASPGVAMIEVYDAGRTDADAPKLMNISSRAFVGRGDAILVAGFVITGEAAKKILIRGAGPSLAAQGVTGSLPDPQIKLFHGSDTVAQNDDWGAGPEKSLVAAAGASVGAFAFPDGSKDAALLIYLQPGIYTAHLAGTNESTGVGMLEVYEITP